LLAVRVRASAEVVSDLRALHGDAVSSVSSVSSVPSVPLPMVGDELFGYTVDVDESAPAGTLEMGTEWID
jgi:hypothetical protein